MAISKRLRYEILRRDNHACRYCGRAAPDVKLHIDHVVPQVLGGSDDPSNLVTSCAECNAGKTSSAPDQHVVADVSGSAAKWSAAMAQAAEESKRLSSGRIEAHDAVINAFPSYYRNRIPSDYTETLNQFLDAGLPADVMVEMARVASDKYGVTKRWNYFCGCCWTKIRQLQERAAELVEEPIPDDDPTGRDAKWRIIHERVQNAFEIAGPEIELNWGFHCWHHTYWPIQSFVKGDKWVCNEPCANPSCLASYATHWGRELLRVTRESNRQGDVMDAADELELMH